MLAEASSLAANTPAFAVTASNGSSSDTPDHDGEDQTSRQPIAASENETVDAQPIAIAGSKIRDSAPVIAGNQNQETDPGRTVLTIGRPASSAHPQPQSKASRPVENHVADSIQQAGDQSAAQQIVVSMPAVMLSEVSFGRSMQRAAASPTASAAPPVVSAVSQSSANSIAQTVSVGADAGRSSMPSSASPAVPPSEIPIGRSMQWEATSPTVSANLPAVSATPQSSANSVAQTGSDAADPSQRSVPSSASPALTPSEVSFGRLMQWKATSPTVSTNPPAFPAAPQSNATSIAQAGSDAADTSQSQVIWSASPAVTPSEVSFGRSMQFEAASPTVSANLPAVPAVSRSNANSIAQTRSNAADTSQSQAPLSASPVVKPSEVFFGRSMQRVAASPTASAVLPALPAVPQSNAILTAQTGNDRADASQSSVLSFALPAVPPSEVAFGRSMQREAAAQTVSTNLPAFSAVPRSNANLTAQTGNDGADASQSQVPQIPLSSASPASPDPSLLAAASAAELVEQSAFAVESTFSPSTFLSTGAGAATLTDKTSQFKSSGATITTNSGDTNSSKAASVQGSISADHSAQTANPSPQHAPGDSSPATTLAIKPLEASVTQTTPVSNHTALITPSQPHAASSSNDVLTKAQDSADAAADQLERAGSTAAAGINTARLLQSMSESEMRVGMHSAEFGDISIRTSVSQQQLTAQINVDHSELGSAIAAHLPSLQSKLGGEFGLHASFELNQLGGSFTSGNGQSSQQHHKMSSQSVLPDSSALHADGDPITLPGELLEDSRLDIRA